MGRNSGKKRKEQSPISKVLASSNKKSMVLKAFFSKLSPHEIRAAVPTLAKHRHFERAISLGDNSFDGTYIRLTPRADLLKNIGWCLGVLDARSESIDAYLATEEKILESVLTGDNERALKLAQSLDEKCGASIWSLGLQGAIYAVSGSTDEKRVLLSKINEFSGDNRFLRTVAGLVATRYEDNATLPAYNNFAEQKIRRGFTGETLHFLMYKIVPLNYEFAYDFSHILNVEKNTCALDIYSCLLDMVRYSIFTTNIENFRSESELIVKSLCRSFPSGIVNSLANDFGIETQFEFIAQEYQALDLYTAGNYEEVCSIFEENLKLSMKFTMFEVWVKSACRTGRFVQGFLGELMRATASIVLKDENYESELAKMLLLCQSFGMLPWFKELHIFIVRESKFISKEVNAKLDRAAVAFSEVNSPRRLDTLPGEVARLYDIAMAESFPDSAVVGLFGGGARGEEFPPPALPEIKVDKYRLDKYIAIRFIEDERYTEAVEILTKLTLCDDAIARNEAYKLLVNTCVTMGEVEMAVSLYVRTVMSNYSMVGTFDSQSLCESAKSIIQDSKSISTPIAFSLHSKNINVDFDAALRFSFEQFLTNNNCKSPLDLFDREESFDIAQLHYFLEVVCTPENMKLYFYFETPREIEECRIEICKRLIEKNHSLEALVFEVKERTKRLVILNAAKHVENSRIYSETSSLINAANFRQLFEVFQSLRAQDFSSSEDEKALSKVMKKLDDFGTIQEREESLAYLHLQNLVLNEKNLVFVRLIKLIRDEFAFGVKGLNGYLSTRIRHGHLPNTLRKSVADQGLVSPKVSATGAFKRNQSWCKKFSYLPEQKVNLIDKELTEFSAKLYELINEVNDKWLQIIVYDQDIAGLDDGALDKVAIFKYSTTFIEAYYLQRFLSLSADYSDFVKVVTAWLWRRTEYNLAHIRSRIDDSLRKRFHKLLDQLEKSVFAIAGESSGWPEFSDAIATSRRKIGTNIDLVIAWFNRSQGLTVPLFDSDVIISIAKWSAGTVVELQDNTDLRFQGWTLSYFVDAMYVLLENCATKSNLSKEQLKVSASFSLSAGTLCIQVTNNCSRIDSLEESNLLLDFYRNSYGKEEFSLKASQGEGGSGFFKVWKTFAKDLDLVHDMKFGYTNAEEFSVLVSIPETELSKILYNENINS